MSKPLLDVIIASTRPGRVGLAVGTWIADLAAAHDGFEVRTIDLAEVGLPFLDEPAHPRLKQYTRQHTKDWSATVDAADAFVFVTPEYNHSYNAVLKNAIDFLHHEWAHKAAGIVSYGGVAAGTRATAHLKPVLTLLRVNVVPEGVTIPFVGEKLDGDGHLVANDIMVAGARAMLDELLRLDGPMRSARAQNA